MSEITQEQKQGYFDKAVAGLKGQGYQRAIDPHYGGSRCLYRGPNGTKCAVGHLIPDDVYTEEMDDPTPLATVIQAIGVPCDSLDGVWSFFNDLQRAHDAGDEPTLMRSNLRDFAATYEIDAGCV